MHMGDLHGDSEGCNWKLVQEHVDLVKRTPGMLAGNVGDSTDNWVGRLQREYANSSATAADGWRLAEWYFNAVPWLYLLGGNHDVWSGHGDPLSFIAQTAGQPYEVHGARLALNLPNGRQLRVNARHDFRGHSMWNPVHGPGKAAQMGADDHIFVCGHKHVFGQGWHKRPSGIWSCALRVGTYKQHDNYSKQEGFQEQNIPAICTMIFPDASEEGFVEVIKDVHAAADFLTWARARHAQSKTVRA
jgi:hypothetical protein